MSKIRNIGMYSFFLSQKAVSVLCLGSKHTYRKREITKKEKKLEKIEKAHKPKCSSLSSKRKA